MKTSSSFNLEFVNQVEEMAAQGYSVDYIIGYFKGYLECDSEEIENRVYDVYESYMENHYL